MSADARAKKAQSLINEVNRITDINFGNYKMQLQEYRRILIDLLVLIRDDAIEEDQALSSHHTTD